MLFSCSNDVNEIHAYRDEQEENLLTTYHNTDLVYSDSAKLQIRIKAGIMKKFDGEEERTEFDNGVHVWFYDELGNPQTELKANRATRMDKTGAMEAFGNVILTNYKGEQLNTEHLVYDEEKDKIHTNEMVKITGEKETIWGEGMVANTTFTKYTVKKYKSQTELENE